MKVSEVIEKLKDMPQDAIVMDFNCGMEVRVQEVVLNSESHTVWLW